MKDIDKSQNRYLTADEVKKSLTQETLTKKILVIDINYLPGEYKDDAIDTTRETLETIYDCKVLSIDGSRQNTQGVQNNNIQPAYFI